MSSEVAFLSSPSTWYSDSPEVESERCLCSAMAGDPTGKPKTSEGSTAPAAGARSAPRDGPAQRVTPHGRRAWAHGCRPHAHGEPPREGCRWQLQRGREGGARRADEDADSTTRRLQGTRRPDGRRTHRRRVTGRNRPPAGDKILTPLLGLRKQTAGREPTPGAVLTAARPGLSVRTRPPALLEIATTGHVLRPETRFRNLNGLKSPTACPLTLTELRTPWEDI